MEGAKEKWYKFVFLLTFFDPYFNLFLLYGKALNRILYNCFLTLQYFLIALLLYIIFLLSSFLHFLLILHGFYLA